MKHNLLRATWRHQIRLTNHKFIASIRNETQFAEGNMETSNKT